MHSFFGKVVGRRGDSSKGSPGGDWKVGWENLKNLVGWVNGQREQLLCPPDLEEALVTTCKTNKGSASY